MFAAASGSRTRSPVVQVIIKALKIDISVRVIWRFGFGRRLHSHFGGGPRLLAMIPCRCFNQGFVLDVSPIRFRRLSGLHIRRRVLHDLGALFQDWILNQFLLDHFGKFELV